VVVVWKVYLFAVALVFVSASATEYELALQPGPEGKDTLVISDDPNTNFDGGAIGFGNFASGDRESLIEWDISELPAGAVVTDATMELYCSYVSGAPTGDVAFNMITESWDEGTVTWNTRPSTTNEDKITADWPEGDLWYAVDITTFVDNWYTGTWDNFGLLVRADTAQDESWAKIYSSDDEEHEQLRPKLTITYMMTGVEGTSLGRVKAVFN
jgi:hypothetical protein